MLRLTFVFYPCFSSLLSYLFPYLSSYLSLLLSLYSYLAPYYQPISPILLCLSLILSSLTLFHSLYCSLSSWGLLLTVHSPLPFKGVRSSFFPLVPSNWTSQVSKSAEDVFKMQSWYGGVRSGTQFTFITITKLL